VLALVAFLVAANPAAARVHGRLALPHISSVRCWPPRTCDGHPHVVAPGGKLRFKGRHLRAGMAVLFRGARRGRGKTRRIVPRLHHAHGLVVRVPAWARSGRLRVMTRRGRRSNAAGPIRVRARPIVPSVSGTGSFEGTGMWIWYVSRSSGGDPVAIAAQAREHAVQTVFVKSSDGTTWWPQFSPELVAALEGQGIRACAWQFVYGVHPATEAALGAQAAATGADCLVIDAESAYEGRYEQAQTYVEALRSKVGEGYPLGLSGFPYVDFHHSFPYSVFLGPGGAQASLPQVYWKAIGTSVDTAVAHTYMWNELYQRPIFPLGQLYQDPSPSDIERFRQLVALRGAKGISWWSWQSAATRGWDAVGSPVAPLAGPPPAPAYPTLAKGTRGDVVLWGQEHLAAAGQPVSPSGLFDAGTQLAVSDFQAGSGLPVTGQLDPATWPVLLNRSPVVPDWTQVARPSALRAARGR
jgi:hypothetical protein